MPHSTFHRTPTSRTPSPATAEVIVARLLKAQVILGYLAIPLSAISVHSIIGLFPSSSILCLLIAASGVKIGSYFVLAAALVWPIGTGLISAVIAWNRWGPRTAANLVVLGLIPIAIGTNILQRWAKDQLSRSHAANSALANLPRSFGVRRLFWGITIVCLTFAVLRPSMHMGERGMFAGYATVMLLFSATLIGWLWMSGTNTEC